jgi:hypothetical protein
MIVTCAELSILQHFSQAKKKGFKLGFLILAIYLLSVLPYLAMAKKRNYKCYCDIDVLNQDQCSFFWRNFGILGISLEFFCFSSANSIDFAKFKKKIA